MKIIIAGGRDFNQKGMMKRIMIQYGISSSDEIVSGHCPTGADALGEELAKFFNAKLKLFPANWNKYGKSAGPKRNAQMAEYADKAIVFWDGKSAGSRNMIEEMKKRSKPVQIIKY